MKKTLTAISASGILALLAIAPAATATPAPAVAAPYCGIQWGSLPKHASVFDQGSTITNVRAGQHRCFDRIVVDVTGDPGGYAVEYTDRVTPPQSDQNVALRGGAKIAVILARSAPYDENGQAVYDPADGRELVSTSGYRTLRQASLAGSFEGQTIFGVGVRARLPMRVFTLDGPGDGGRLVIDVAHRW